MTGATLGAARATVQWRAKLARPVPGLAVALLVAAVATAGGKLVPVVGGPVLAILLGAVAGAVVPGLRGWRFSPGYAIASRPVLQLSIVVLGTGLSIQQVVHVGGQSLPVMLGTLAVALGGAWVLGRLLGVRGDTQTLIGVGTGICGASAIAATSAVLKPKEANIAYALGTIFTFNVAAVLLFPPLGHALGMSPHAFGLWAGTAVNDTSSVVAASYAYGGDAGSYGLVVKLTRTLTLIPIVLFLAVLVARKQSGGRVSLRAMPWHRLVPPFLIGFLAAATVESAGWIPQSWHAPLSTLGTFLITMALAGIGLALKPSDLRKAGHKPLLMGAILWVAVAASSLGLQALTGGM
ncbi:MULTISPECIES: YeiH family protein [Amycolatopsis]|uniref:Putative sulfate exporter family transporter n=1 Tax=Amycolatopsis dendrobii TaxID=2760662 RepID=A0A7W3VXJ3_9PSEU|nr:MULTISPECIES: putative sulfate exporter family transporter [Amycolatopsis]MBB1154945.1 putative sulfate exporter family transporter [Amycolatopsis dendrobii]UKD56246.1 putative sulfate exporter family transporter [Amycolatopsis sp. FU40]